jgi:hypothetical protein
LISAGLDISLSTAGQLLQIFAQWFIETGLDEYQEGVVNDDGWNKDRDSKEIDAKKTQIYNAGREKVKLHEFVSKEIFHQVQGEK